MESELSPRQSRKINSSSIHTKFAEKDLKKLLDSQENILSRLSEVLSQSSDSTNLGDFEEQILQGTDKINFIADTEINESNYTAASNFHSKEQKFRIDGRTTQSSSQLETTIHRRKKMTSSFEALHKDNIKRRKLDDCCSTDSGLGTSEPSNLGMNWEIGELDFGGTQTFSVNEFELGTDSEQSVSMLQDQYDERPPIRSPNLEIGSVMEMRNITDEEEPEGSWNVREFPTQISTDDDSSTTKSPPDSLDKHAQTDFSMFYDSTDADLEENARKNALFIARIVRLKDILVLKNELPTDKLSDILKNIYVDENASHSEPKRPEDKNTNLVPNETVEYLLRSTDTENVLSETAKALLMYLKESINNNLELMACYWRNSVYELALEALNLAVDRVPSIRKMVSLFLCDTVDSIMENTKTQKNLILECKSTFVVMFCQSVYLCHDVINYIMQKILLIKKIKHIGGRATRGKKIKSPQHIKSVYFLIRINEALLKSFKEKFHGKNIQELFGQNSKEKDANVLELWKKHWRQEETVESSIDVRQTHNITVSKWCDDLNDVLMHCVKYLPVFITSVERCVVLTKDILNECHPDLTKSVTIPKLKCPVSI